MAAIITFDALSSGNSTSDGTSFSWNHTINTGQNKILVVGFTTRGRTGASAVGQTVSYAGFPCIKIRRDAPGADVAAELWYLLNPPTGTASIAVTVNFATSIVGGGLSYFGVLGVGPLTSGTTGGASTAATTSPPAGVANNLLIDAIGLQSGNTSLAKTGSQTQRINLVFTANSVLGMGELAGSPEGTLSWSFTSDSWAMSAAVLLPAHNFVKTINLRPRIFAPGVAR